MRHTLQAFGHTSPWTRQRLTFGYQSWRKQCAMHSVTRYGVVRRGARSRVVAVTLRASLPAEPVRHSGCRAGRHAKSAEARILQARPQMGTSCVGVGSWVPVLTLVAVWCSTPTRTAGRRRRRPSSRPSASFTRFSRIQSAEKRACSLTMAMVDVALPLVLVR